MLCFCGVSGRDNEGVVHAWGGACWDGGDSGGVLCGCTVWSTLGPLAFNIHIGRLTEAERRLRALDEYVHAHDAGAAVGDLSARLGSVEASVAHLAASDAGMKSSLGGLQVCGVACVSACRCMHVLCLLLRSVQVATQPHPPACVPTCLPACPHVCRTWWASSRQRWWRWSCGPRWPDQMAAATACRCCSGGIGAVRRTRSVWSAGRCSPPQGLGKCSSTTAAARGLQCLASCPKRLPRLPRAAQWLERAREALRREVADIQQQHGQLAAGLTSAVAVAAAAPAASPQKALAVQVGHVGG